MRLSLFALIDGWLAPPPPTRKAGWIGECTFAHRGLHGEGAPENSPTAFAAAIECGLGIECDVQRSHDGQAMVFHDWELDRLTGETGPVAVLGADRLCGIALTGSADCIPTLRQLLDLVAGRVPLLIEVKSRREMPIAGLCEAIRRETASYTGHHGVMSFDPRVPRWFAIHSPDTVRGLVVTEEGGKGVAGALRRRSAFWYARPEFLAYDIRDFPSHFPALQRRRGFPIATWTVRSEEQRERARRYADAPIAEGAWLARAS